MPAPDRMDERLRALGLVEAQRTAEALFAGVTARGLIAPGRSEYEVTDRIGALHRESSVAGAPWPGRLVLSGRHTLLPCGQEPRADRVIDVDDIVIARLGPLLLGGHGTDFARTLVLGDDPDRLRLHEDLPKVFAAAREAYQADAGISGRELHEVLRALAAKAGWSLGGWQAGHLVGEVPAPHPRGARAEAYIGPDNGRPLRRTVQGGWQAHWLLEVHLVDEHRGFGGSFKQLLALI
ncbi:M24 family metallopeptidase [Streptomyces sp. NPDC002467]|uniref:M24 family metallopeptidase n=1 Tax=Streptomyces sp. NPDC002467 TaxID=3364647 RepID=UPI003689B365